MPTEAPNIVQFEHGALPPSLNAIGTRGSHWKVNKVKRAWQVIFTLRLLEAGMPQHIGGRPAAERIAAIAYLRFPDRRHRDEGNWAWIIEKSLGDALVGGYSRHPPLPGRKRPRYLRTWPEGRFLPDDDNSHFRFQGARIEPERGPKRIRIVIRWWPPAPSQPRPADTQLPLDLQ